MDNIMNNLQIFNNPEFGKVRVVELDGEPWLVGKDVAQALGYSAERNAIAAHVDDEDIPTKSGAAAWLGIDRSTLNSWKRGEYRQNTHHEFAQRLDQVFESMLVELLLSNKIFPASGIFLLKNYNDFRDQIDIAPTVAQPLGDLPDPEVLRKKIEANAIED